MEVSPTEKTFFTVHSPSSGSFESLSKAMHHTGYIFNTHHKQIILLISRKNHNTRENKFSEVGLIEGTRSRGKPRGKWTDDIKV